MCFLALAGQIYIRIVEATRMYVCVQPDSGQAPSIETRDPRRRVRATCLAEGASGEEQLGVIGRA